MKTVLVLLLCLYSVQGYNDTIEKKQSGSAGAPAGDLMVQRLTTAFNWINHLFWWEDEKTLFCADKEMDKSHRWKYDGGETTTRYYKEISGESFIFSMPTKQDSKKGIIGSDQNLRTISYSKDGKQFTISEPVLTLNDKGYCMHNAHCDKEGTLYIISNYKLKCRDPSKGGILYKIKNQVAEKVEQFKTKVNDFVFSNDYKKMFIICDNGKIIAEYDFDMDKGTISNHKRLFNVTEVDEGSGCSMTSIEIDNKDNFWVTTDDGLVVRIDKNNQVTKILETPFCALTAITFGGYQNKNLIVGSKKECSPELQAGSMLIVTGLDTKGTADVPVKW